MNNKANDEMGISFIVPMYNAYQYLDRCLESLNKQDMSNIEILLVDDGSQDNTCEIAEKYTEKDKRFKLFKTVHGGVAKARNLALSKARGKYVAFVDADDYIYEDYCRKLYELADKNKAQMVSFKYDLVYEGDIKVKTEKLKDKVYHLTDDSHELVDLYLGGFYQGLTISNHLYSRKFLMENDIKFEMNVGEDILFNLRILNVIKDFVQTNQSFYAYVQRKSSCIHTLRNPGQGSLDTIRNFCKTDSPLKPYVYGVEFTGFLFCHGSERISAVRFTELLRELKKIDSFEMIQQSIKAGTLKELPDRKVISKKIYYFELYVNWCMRHSLEDLAGVAMRLTALLIFKLKRREPYELQE